MSAAPDSDGLIWRVIALIVTFVGGVLSFLFARVVKKHDEEIAAIRSDIKAVFDKVETKADKGEQMLMRSHIDELFRQSRVDHENTLRAIGDLKTTVVEGMNQRPTRDELSNTGSHRRRTYDKP